MRIVIALLALFIVATLTTPATPAPRDMDCAYRWVHRTSPYACYHDKSYIYCMACLDRKATTCRKEIQSSCGLNWTEAKEQCSTGKYLAERICAGDFAEVNQ